MTCEDCYMGSAVDCTAPLPPCRCDCHQEWAREIVEGSTDE